jgi:hypothetical protein
MQVVTVEEVEQERRARRRRKPRRTLRGVALWLWEWKQGPAVALAGYLRECKGDDDEV